MPQFLYRMFSHTFYRYFSKEFRVIGLFTQSVYTLAISISYVVVLRCCQTCSTVLIIIIFLYTNILLPKLFCFSTFFLIADRHYGAIQSQNPLRLKY